MLYHITLVTDWETTDEEYHAASLETEGFIHCSFAHQLLPTAELLFAEAPPLLVLCIDPQKLSAKAIVEDSYGSGQEFPHIYGTVPKKAVVSALPFLKDPTGKFMMPEGIDDIEES